MQKLNFASQSFSNVPVAARAAALSKDGATVICWHPREDIPYEMTKEIPRNIDMTRTAASPLKVQLHRPSPTIQEIAKALQKSTRNLKPRRKERAFNPYFWEDLHSRRRL
ncbi:39S ribosomal protein L42, mitochondrial [Sparganum proliferum]